MSLSKEQIKIAAMELNPVDREALAQELLLSISGAEREAVDAAWLDEAKRRDATFRQRGGTAKPVDEVITRLKENPRP
jgi:hypothetical protein